MGCGFSMEFFCLFWRASQNNPDWNEIMLSGKPRGAKPELALVVIARNEERCIARCINSASALVDKMVVLDTGSTDKTMAIAKACGAEVHQAIWTDDFSAARNTALALADADWNLILDADEWIASGAECLRHAVSRLAVGVVCVRNDLELHGELATNNSWIPRLLPRGVHYTGRIHEQPVSDLPRIRLPLVLGHDGYAPERKKAKLGRNRSLLEQELQQHPGDPYLLYQLGKDCAAADENAQACEYYLQAAAKLPAGAGYEHQLVVGTLHCLGRVGQLEQALIYAEAKMNDWSDSPDFFFTLGNLLLDYALIHADQAEAKWLPMAEAAWLRCLEIGERPKLSGSLAGCGSYLASHNLAVIYEGMGDTERAKAYRELG